jgi:RimJ/RimL family protein N-acetyltransferase
LKLSVREIEKRDIEKIADYWLHSTPEHLTGMGVDLAKLPAREEWIKMLNDQLGSSIEEKKSYCIIWEADGNAVGHCNINKIVFGDNAYMHLHIWQNGLRKKGAGQELVKKTLPWFFEKYQLKTLFCEPYALNPAPNKLLEKIGFEFVKEHITIPGYLNFEQPVKLWKLSSDKFNGINQQ